MTQSDETLYLAMLQGDKQAFSTLYHRYFDKLVWFAQQHLYNKSEAEDVVQEVFEKMITSPKQFDTSQKFNTWAYTLTANRCKNTIRNKTNRHKIEQEELSTLDKIEPNLNIDANLLKQQLSTIFKELNSKEKMLFVLKFEQSLSTKETAEAIGIPEGSVKSGLFYLLKKIKDKIKYYHD